MNEPRADDDLLDLLVDDELGEAQRRDVLAWCEREPDGWRRCALAFLEAQSWAQALRDGGNRELGVGSGERGYEVPATRVGPCLSASSSHNSEFPMRNPERAGTSAPRSAQPIGRSNTWLFPLSMAASFLLAFTLGLLIRGGTLSRTATPSQNAIDDARNNQVALESPDAALGGRTQRPLDNVRLVWDGPPGQSQSIELPVVEGKSLDENWLHSDSSAFPPEILRALEKMGHRVEQRRELVPFEMQDGRRLIVPVDQVEVQPVSRRAYQ
jgi:hypothetical protein